MEKISYEFAAGDPATARVLTGVVGSGDLEVLIEPPHVSNRTGITTIQVNTSVDGMNNVWEALLRRIFTAALLPAMKIDINDFGATPGVVRLRIEQAFEELRQV
ncbi:malonate decarboxylase subunit delta [Glaciimonas sp. Gout2]|uniref:malonate decarboxylase subunit delta n=1 Tax=unclassified Glaciimonas TaxID=2644401 RepID=UPI002B228649|nr:MULTISPECIES: malonate decarboxylase subunit delta [unclassified Glaciimonas]MEB0010153.1 malonate decarboxylase subunit delta [Glaciimonas sp. Cout2]MEB0084172.1 malonate decarboxylase subunit delta [Glaciimonas sp. Gout2]